MRRRTCVATRPTGAFTLPDCSDTLGGAETSDLPARAHHALALFEPDAYVIQVQSEDRARCEHRIGADEFDCNSHSTRIPFAPTADVEYGTSRTLLYCGSAATRGTG